MDRDKKKRPPTDKQIKDAQRRVGYNKLELSNANFKVRKKMIEVSIDLSASAKGLAVDKVASHLESFGIANYLVEIGGEIKVRGDKRGRPWQVAIASPRPDKKSPYQRVLPIKNKAMATSGDYRNFFEYKGERYSHTLDAKIGRPVKNRLVSVTVIDDKCLEADGWATALMAMGLKKGVQLADKENLTALFIYKKENGLATLASKMFKKHYGEK